MASAGASLRSHCKSRQGKKELRADLSLPTPSGSAAIGAVAKSGAEETLVATKQSMSLMPN